MKKSLFVLTLLLLGMFSVAQVFAQQQPRLNITINPTAIDLLMTPDSKSSQKFKIRNNSDKDITLGISVDTLANTDNGQVLPVETKTKNPDTKFLSFEHPTFTARSREWTDVPLTISIPKTAGFSYYYAVRIGQVAKSEGGKSQVLGEVIVPILIQVKQPGAKASAQLVSFKPSSGINQYLPVTFETTIKNTGNVHIRPRGNIFIKTGSKDISNMEVNEGNGAILPDGTRTFTTPWVDGFIVREPVLEDNLPKLDSHGKPETKLTINWDKLTSFRIGKYTAVLVMVYDNGKTDVVMEGNTTFWVIPYIPIGAAIISLILCIVIIRFVLKWYISSQVKKYQSH